MFQSTGKKTKNKTCVSVQIYMGILLTLCYDSVFINFTAAILTHIH